MREEKFKWIMIFSVIILALLLGFGGGMGVGCRLWRHVVEKPPAAKDETAEATKESDTCKKEFETCKGDLNNCQREGNSLKNDNKKHKEELESCKGDLNNCQREGDSLEAANKKLYEDNQLMQLRNTVYLEILKKWRLPIPEDTQLEKFSIKEYFCQNWKPWYKTEMTKVRQEYNNSECEQKCTCPKCNLPPTKKKCTKKIYLAKPPKEKPYVPPVPKVPETIEHIIPGPTAPCPQEN